MPDIIVSDTSCLILLDKIGRLDILNSVYGTIYITPEVQAEYGEELPQWIQLRTPANT